MSRSPSGSAAFGETLHQYQRNLYAAASTGPESRSGTISSSPVWDGGRASFTNIFAPELSRRLEADALVLALGRVPVRELDVQGAVEVGDRLSPRSLEEAILEGSLAGRAVG